MELAGFFCGIVRAGRSCCSTPVRVITPHPFFPRPRPSLPQAFSDPARAQFLLARKTMEINPRHPIIAELNSRAEADAEGAGGEDTADLARLLYDTALLNSGFAIDDAKDFAGRMYRLMRAGLKLESLELLPEVELPPEVRDLELYVVMGLHIGSNSQTCALAGQSLSSTPIAHYYYYCAGSRPDFISAQHKHLLFFR